MTVSALLLGSSALLAQGTYTWPNASSGAQGYYNVSYTSPARGSFSLQYNGLGSNAIWALCSNLVYDFFIGINNSNPPQNLFKSIVVQDSTGAYRVYNASAASYLTNAGTAGGTAQWAWGTGSSPVNPYSTGGTQSFAIY